MYKTYIISLASSGTGAYLKSAKEWLPQSINSCVLHGWDVKVFSAVNGYNIKDSVWAEQGLKLPAKSKNKDKKSIGDLPGAQGCFLSHYILWNTCIEINQPIVILEDDAIVTAPLSYINSDYDLVKLHAPRASGQNKLGHWSTGAFAYWLSTNGAKKLVEFSKTHGPILADKIIASSILNWGYLDFPVVELGRRIGSSTQPEKYPYKFY